MTRFVRLVAVVGIASAVGISLGLLLCGKSKAASKVVKKVAEKSERPEGHGFRSGFRVEATSPQPNVLLVRGLFLVGRPAPHDEIRAQHLTILDAGGKVVFDKELGRVAVAAGEEGGRFPFEEKIEVLSGTYRVHVFSHVPGHTLEENGVKGPQIASDSWRTVEVDPGE